MKIRFDAELLRRYGGRGPRYTSYPTALQFTERLTADDYQRNAVASNGGGLPLSLYVHIPFCHSLCYYCACNKIVTRNHARVRRYLECLHQEIEFQAELFDDTRQVEQLHFGGGTPTYLDDGQIADLMTKLDTEFGLDVSGRHEYSLEVDPRSVDGARIRKLSQLGFNRLSLGVQDFDQRVQLAVNRSQSAKGVETLTRQARNAGFRSVSFDLMYGLPHQTPASFSATLDVVTKIRPDRLAVYNYAHLPERFKGQRMIDSRAIPPPAIKLDILRRTIEHLHDAGYCYVGMDHFALPGDDLVTARHNGTLQRNFQGYSTHRDCDLVGLGVSAIGSIGTVYAQNSASTIDYETSITSGELPIARGIRVDQDDRRRAAAIQSLMCFDELVFDEFSATHGMDTRQYFANEIKQLRRLEDDGLVTVDARGIFVTDVGRLLLRSIAMVFDRYLDNGDDAYSKAI